MKVKELIKELQELNQETEICILLRKKYRPLGSKPITYIHPYIDQDTNRLSTYAIDVDIEFEYSEEENKKET